MTKLDRRAEDIVERSWPERAGDADLVKKVRKHLKNNVSVHSHGPDGWSDHKKRHRALLRERKQIAKDRYEGREVRLVHGQPSYNWESSISNAFREREVRGTVEDVRIRDGLITYFLDVKPRGISSRRLIEMEVVDDA